MAIPRITVVGSYATGLTMKVDRLPSTGETLLGTGYRVDYGGKGSNQAVGLRQARGSSQLHRENWEAMLSPKWRSASIARRRLTSLT